MFGPMKYPGEKIWTREIPTRKFFKPTKYPRKKILDLRNIHEKINLDPRNTHAKKIGPAKYPREKIWTHEIPTIKIFEPTKYPREQILDPQIIHERKIWTISLCLDP